MSETRETPTRVAPSAPDTAPSSFGRRSFLFAAAGTGAAGVAAVAGIGAAPAVQAEALSTPDGTAAGYRETAHVTRYYRSTRL